MKLALALLSLTPLFQDPGAILPWTRSATEAPRPGARGFTVSNLGVAALGSGSPTTGSNTASLVGKRYVALVVKESQEGDTDLNGDGDSEDEVLLIHDRTTGTLKNTGLSILGELLPLVYRGTIVTLIQEDVDLNGDGDDFDNVAHLYDPAAGVLTNLRLAVPATFVSVTRGRFRQCDGALLMELTEADSEDFNGDGDRKDVVLDLQLLGPRSGLVPSVPAVALQTLGPRRATGRFPVASSLFALDEDWLVLGVDEPDEGQRDLNGDGDAVDPNVLYATSTRNTATHGIGIAGDFLGLSSGRLAFRASEPSEGQDLNADGDQLDGVLFVYDLETRVLTNLGLAVTTVAIQKGAVSALVSEAANGSGDLNGDGDTSDNVAFVHHLDSGLTTNLGLAAAFLAARGEKLLFGVGETSQGVTDLNGDADAIDIVLHAYDLPSQTTLNLMTATSGAARIGERFVSVFVDETAQNADFNFDGDFLDQVLGVYDSVSDIFANTALAADSFALNIQESGDRVAFAVLETKQGGTDLNGDGDTNDPVVHVWDAVTGTGTNLGLAVANDRDIGFGYGRLLLMVHETFQQADLNGDGDLSDRVAHLVELP